MATGVETYKSKTFSGVLKGLHEYFLAGYYEEPEKTPFERWSRAVRRRFEHRPPPAYAGEHLYPSGRINDLDTANLIVSPTYSYTWHYSDEKLKSAIASSDDPDVRECLESVRSDMENLRDTLNVITTPHTVGGNAYTHSIPNYGRIIREGFVSYERRILTGLRQSLTAGDGEKAAFYRGLQDVLEGVRAWHGTICSYLADLECGDIGAERRRRLLVSSFATIPEQPAQTFFEALLCYNFIYYIDDCDNPGRIDQELYPYYRRDTSQGMIALPEAVELFQEYFFNCDINSGWSTGIGGTAPDGGPGYNDLTLACLKAAAAMRRPNLQLHVRKDMPDITWDAAFDTLQTGTGLPAFYHDELFDSALLSAGLEIDPGDLPWRNGGGCTETMVHGRSNVGSLDAGLNLPLVLQNTLSRALPHAVTFEDLMVEYRRDLDVVIQEITAQVSRSQELKSRFRPQPMRSLLIDDCIDRGIGFNRGGARYNWSVINVAGLANAADSLEAVREILFEREEISPAELLHALAVDFTGYEELRTRLSACEKYGNDEDRVDGLAKDIGDYVFSRFLEKTPWRGGRFLPSCLMFVTYGMAGESIGASPDGRKAGEPIADSAGPHQGRDVHGPTAMLRSVSSIPHHLAPGTLVVNIRIAKELLSSTEQRQKVKDMIRAYFDMGGMQLQINVVDQETLRRAIECPDEYADLIVRVGGYSEYFNRLSHKLKLSVLERVVHTG